MYPQLDNPDITEDDYLRITGRSKQTVRKIRRVQAEREMIANFQPPQH
jgi:hypothetical protein